MISIRDIKPNVEIVDYCFFAFVGGITILIIAIIFFLIKFMKNKKQNPKLRILNQLKNLNFNNPKECAYLFTELARFFLNEENKKEYEEIVKRLEKYKYKKVVPPLSDEDIKKIEKFIKGIGV